MEGVINVSLWSLKAQNNNDDNKMYQDNQELITYILAFSLLDGNTKKQNLQEKFLNLIGQHWNTNTRSY